MKPLNIDAFDKCVAIVLVVLYEQFPVRIDDMKFNDLAIKLFNENDEPVDHHDHIEVLYSTVGWLEKAGYIWMSGINSLHAFNVTLSPKGLELLKMMPESLHESKRTIGQVLVEAMTTGAKESISTIISIALTEGYKVLTRDV